MNTITRMVLVPEDQLNDIHFNNMNDVNHNHNHHASSLKKKNKLDPILNSDLPSNLKIKLLNQILLKNDIHSMQKKKIKESELKKDIENRYKIWKGIKKEQNESKSTQIKTDNIHDADSDDTLMESDSEESYYSLLDDLNKQTNISKDKNKESDHNHLQATVSPPLMTEPSSNVENNNTNTKHKLLFALKAQKNLVSNDNKIQGSHGKIKGSEIESIVDYLSNTAWNGKAPNGTNTVIEYIKDNNLPCRNLVKNLAAKNKLKAHKLSWTDLRRF